MRRLIAILLGAALVSTAAHVSRLHTHAYRDHDHPEHHHGLAAHEHHRAALHPEETGAHLEDCDPGRHVISFSFVCAASLEQHTVKAEICTPASLSPEPAIEASVGYADVRVHGPPVAAHSSPRAPPSIAHA